MVYIDRLSQFVNSSMRGSVEVAQARSTSESSRLLVTWILHFAFVYFEKIITFLSLGRSAVGEEREE